MTTHMWSALAAISALHVEAPNTDLSGWSGRCDECSRSWPCPTRQLADAALHAVESDDDDDAWRVM